jgi:hypothetical protein
MSSLGGSEMGESGKPTARSSGSDARKIEDRKGGVNRIVAG